LTGSRTTWPGNGKHCGSQPCKTGLYYLEKGEAVIPKEENKQGESSGFSFQFGDIIVQGAEKSPEQLAREIVRPLREELLNLNIITNR